MMRAWLVALMLCASTVHAQALKGTDQHLAVISVPRARTLPNNDITPYAVAATGTAITLTVPPSGHALENITVTGNTTLSLPVAVWLGQQMITNSCQDGSHVPTFNGVAGVTLKGTYPTASPSKCDLCSWMATATNGTSTTTWQFGNCAQNE